MQPVRAIIAAIFIVIGALIVIPAFLTDNDTSNASGTPSPSVSETDPSAQPTGTGTPTGTSTKSPTKTPTKEPEPTKTPTPSATPSASQPPASQPPATQPATQPPATPKPSPSQTKPPAAPPAVPGAGLTVAFGKIDCPSKEITVRVTNDGADSQGYSITRNGSVVLADRLGAAASRSSEIALAEDKNVIVRVTQDGETVKSRTYKLNCVKGGAAPASEKPERLPETGSGTGTLVARLATGAASIITGAIILWWGGLWPRRREGMFGSSDRG